MADAVNAFAVGAGFSAGRFGLLMVTIVVGFYFLWGAWTLRRLFSLWTDDQLELKDLSVNTIKIILVTSLVTLYVSVVG